MRWVTASELEQWARSTTARDTLPEIVSDLILASSPDITAIRFLSRDKGQVRGFDGVLVSDAAALTFLKGSHIGRSVQTQTTKPRRKPTSRRGHGRSRAAEQADITLVLVSPWTWDTSGPKNKLEDWLNARKASSSWKDVHYIDGSMLEIWLEQRPAVAAWHARRTLGVKPQEGVRSTDLDRTMSLDRAHRATAFASHLPETAIPLSARAGHTTNVRFLVSPSQSGSSQSHPSETSRSTTVKGRFGSGLTKLRLSIASPVCPRKATSERMYICAA